jgi:hypothetical protein
METQQQRFSTQTEIGLYYSAYENGRLVLTDSHRKMLDDFYASTRRGFAKDAAISTSALSLAAKDQARGRCAAGLDGDDFAEDDAIAQDENERNEMLQKLFDEARGQRGARVEFPSTVPLDPDKAVLETRDYGDRANQHLFDQARLAARRTR